MSEKVYTQEALDALLADARKKASEEASAELTSTVAQLEADLAAKTTELTKAQSDLDVANAKAVALETQIAERDEAEALAKTGEERAAKVKEAVNLSDETIAERTAGWAGMSEEAFEQTLKDMEAAVEVASHGKTKPPKSNAVDSTRETAGMDDTDTKALNSFFGSLANA